METEKRQLIGVYVSAKEADWVRKKCEQKRLSLSNYVRSALGLKPGGRPGRPRKIEAEAS